MRSQTSGCYKKDVSCVNEHTPARTVSGLSVLFRFCLQGLPNAAELHRC
jgi:hypothetical protein